MIHILFYLLLTVDKKCTQDCALIAKAAKILKIHEYFSFSDGLIMWKTY